MSEREKLLAKLLSNPKDFSFKELASLMKKCGYSLNNKGKTSGSRISFLGNSYTLRLHKPHQRNYLLDYQVKDVIEFLIKEGIIHD